MKTQPMGRKPFRLCRASLLCHATWLLSVAFCFESAWGQLVDAGVFHYSFSSGTSLASIADQSGAGNSATAGPLAVLSSDVPAAHVPPTAGNRSLDSSDPSATDGNPSGALSSALQSLANSTVQAAGGFTMECWFQWKGGGAINSIIDYAGTEKIVLEQEGDGVRQVQMKIDGNTVATLGGVSPDAWHYVAIVFDTSGSDVAPDGSLTGTLLGYLDSLAPTANQSNVTKSTFGDGLNRAIGIGQHPFGFDRFDGLIFEPRVTLGALNPQDLLFVPEVIPEPPAPSAFIRGDADQDGIVTLNDGISTLGFLFLGDAGLVSQCLDAADANDDGAVELVDAVLVLNFLFLGAPPPPAPGPFECGVDTTDDALGCESFLACLPEPGFLRVDAARIDGEGTAIEIAPGEPFEVEIDFSAQNSAGDPQRLRQLVVGMDNAPIACLYHGVPSPTETLTTTRSLSLNAPLEEGTSELFASDDEQDACEEALGRYAPHPDLRIATIVVTGPLPGTQITSVSLNGEGPAVSVIPGATIEATIEFTQTNSKTCPTCPRQLVVGLANEPLECLTSGAPPVAPTETPALGLETVRFSAPRLPGTYSLYAKDQLAPSCEEALSLYGSRDEDDEPIAQFVVEPGAYAEFVNVTQVLGPAVIDGVAWVSGPGVATPEYRSENLTVPPERTAVLEVGYSAVSDPDHLDTGQALVIGIDGEPPVCVYNGIPGAAPTSGRNTIVLNTPSLPGTYPIYQYQYEGFPESALCSLAEQAYVRDLPLWRPAAEPIGTLTVEPGVFVVGVSNNIQDANDITVDEGETVELLVAYQASNSPDCPDCSRQLVFGSDKNRSFLPTDCLGIVDVPVSSPLRAFATLRYTMEEGGIYDLYATHHQEANCVFARPKFRNPDLHESAVRIATVRVRSVAATSSRLTRLGQMPGPRDMDSGTPGDPANIQVERGDEIDLTVSWSAENCFADTGCARRQLLIIHEGKPLDCVRPPNNDFDGNEGTETIRFRAPQQLGTYQIWTAAGFEAGSELEACEAAVAAYRRVEPAADQIIGTYEVFETLPDPPLPGRLEPTRESFDLPAALDLDFELTDSGMEGSNAFIEALEAALNSAGDSITLNITIQAEASLFKLVDVGRSASFSAGIERVEQDDANAPDVYELSLALAATRCASVGIGDAAKARVSQGVEGTIIFTVRSLREIPKAFEQFAIALMLEPAKGAINAVIGVLNDTIAALDDAITEVENAIAALEGLLDLLGQAAAEKARCLENDWTLAADPVACANCAINRLRSQLQDFVEQQTQKLEMRDDNMEAIGMLSSAQGYFESGGDGPFVSIAFGVELQLSASLESELSPFPGISIEGLTIGSSFSGTLALSGRIELGTTGPETATIAVRGQNDISNTLLQLTGSTTQGFEIETEFAFRNDQDEYEPSAEASVTLFIDQEGILIGPVRTGIGRRIEVEIDVAEFQSSGEAIFALLNGGGTNSLEALGKALARIPATFRVQDRLLLGLGFGLSIDVQVASVGFSGRLFWTNSGPSTESTFVLGEALEELFSPETGEALAQTFQQALLE